MYFQAPKMAHPNETEVYPKFIVQLSRKLNQCSSSIAITTHICYTNDPEKWCCSNFLAHRCEINGIGTRTIYSVSANATEVLYCHKRKICAHREIDVYWVTQLRTEILNGFPLKEQSLLLFVLLRCGFAASGFSTPSIQHAISFVHHAQNRGLKFKRKLWWS